MLPTMQLPTLRWNLLFLLRRRGRRCRRGVVGRGDREGAVLIGGGHETSWFRRGGGGAGGCCLRHAWRLGGVVRRRIFRLDADDTVDERDAAMHGVEEAMSAGERVR